MPHEGVGPSVVCLRASAGAGKTHRLTEEFLLLLSLHPPDREYLRQIVAITFTNKAAAEMKERIIGRLKGIALRLEGGMAPERAAGWLEVILRHYGDFHVRTIDSLVYAFLRALALEVGVRPQLEVTFREEEVLDRCFDALLCRVDGQGDGGLRGWLEELVQCYLLIEKRSGLRIEGALRRRLHELFPRTEEGVLLRDSPLEEVRRRIGELSRDLLSTADPELLRPKAREVLEAPLDHLEKDLAFWRGKAFKAPPPPEVEALYRRILELRETYIRERPRARLLPYLRVLALLKEEVDRIAREEGVLLGGRWITLLKGHLEELSASYAFLKFGSRIRYFLIDEFQDTDRLQWETLRPLVEEALSQGGGLFYVGDPKQAIYGWRGSDWRLFGKAIREDFPTVPPDGRREELLGRNYRSLERIVDFNNRLFALLADGDFSRDMARGILGKEASAEHIEEFTSILREGFGDVRQGCVRGPGGTVRVTPFCAPKEELYPKVRQRLSQEVPRVWRERGEGVAVLVRNNEQAEEVATWLQAEGVPVVTENSLRLKRSQLVKGVVALLRFLDYPPDDLALWGALSSRIFHDLEGLPSESLEAFLAEGGWSPPLYKAFSARFPRGFQQHLQPLLRRVGYVAPYELVREVFRRLRLLERFPEEAPLLWRLLEVVFRSERAGVGSLSAFLAFWQQEGMEQRVGLPEGLEAVRVMTIHKAKGLQFPVVFVPFTNWRLRLPEFLRTEDGELLYLTNPLPPDLVALRLRKKMDEAVEALNLLYVATTRAMEELHLYVTCYPQGKGVNRGFLSAWLKEMLDRTGLWGC